jgi:hypothetical protein
MKNEKKAVFSKFSKNLPSGLKEQNFLFLTI